MQRDGGQDRSAEANSFLATHEMKRQASEGSAKSQADWRARSTADSIEIAQIANRFGHVPRNVAQFARDALKNSFVDSSSAGTDEKPCDGCAGVDVKIGIACADQMRRYAQTAGTGGSLRFQFRKMSTFFGGHSLTGRFPINKIVEPLEHNAGGKVSERSEASRHDMEGGVESDGEGLFTELGFVRNIEDAFVSAHGI